MLRSLAALTLLVWLAAIGFCSADCSLGIGHGGGEHGSCHNPTASESHHDDSDSPDPTHGHSSTAAACLSLKTALSGSGVLVPVQPKPCVLYMLGPVGPALGVTLIDPSVPFYRQAWRRDWVFTPEVSLGPAHRSLAPPFPR